MDTSAWFMESPDHEAERSNLMDTTNLNLSLIGNTIRTVAKDEAERYYRSELAHNLDDASIVFGAVTGAVWVALKRSGLSTKQVMEEIDPTDEIIAVMKEVGYDL